MARQSREKVMERRLMKAMIALIKIAEPDPDWPGWLVCFPEPGIIKFLAAKLRISPNQANTVQRKLAADGQIELAKNRSGAVWVLEQSFELPTNVAEVAPDSESPAPQPAGYSEPELIKLLADYQEQIEICEERKAVILEALLRKPRGIVL